MVTVVFVVMAAVAAVRAAAAVAAVPYRDIGSVLAALLSLRRVLLCPAMGLRAPPWQGAAQPACASAPASGLGGFFWVALLSPGGEGIVEISCAWNDRAKWQLQ